MKVVEEGSDRSAEMGICIEGSADRLPEYGEYVDPVDHAICSYIPLEKGQKPRFSGKFKGTTLDIVCDAFMDGILRKSYSYGAKAVRFQKGKKIEIDKFLFKTEDGFIDSQMVVSTLGMPTTQSDSPETIGTMELRLYCTRKIGVSHEVKGIKQYYTGDKQDSDNEESETPDNEDGQKHDNSNKGSEETKQIVSYRQIAPTSQLDIERNSTPISVRTVASHYNKMGLSRPGEEPWAIFRFHYRSKEALESSGVKQSVTLALRLQVKDPFQSEPGAKRLSATTKETLPEPKRLKVLPPSPSSTASSLKSQLAERRKKLAELHKNHRQEAETLATIQRKIEPYEQRMVEELERINQEITEEETALKEAVERRSHFEKVLQEFEDSQDDAQN
ncbi:hypothetical protein COCC4DRAFT_136632 [Bipolaris maydis ATCC 48331]|uniref:Uncharacterized protein n=2 Tax=Cochliobolus heterostrophus TaxID=5016 RepID=M2UT37_COCH5|nr:uncharacterized protein COCC4DRAFT_136632 [Bipolaris maydis ATCC 48331]EMD91047.1 hypothetical protein COCHEDRAFT_1156392 [Bipolaris maydis C5]ENI05869.1 hypothetical protein COCC4DRAFT_136632 [Bipolaris maydis ATCC 48331]